MPLIHGFMLIMANRRVSSSSPEYVQQCARVTEVLLKYNQYLKNDADGKVKWLGNLKELKLIVFDIFGEDGKWSSPGGSAKTFRNNQATITWYANKKTLLFQGQTGNVIKAQIIDLHETECVALNDDHNDDNDNEPKGPSNHGAISECTECRRLSIEMAEVKLDVEILRVMLNKFDESLNKSVTSVVRKTALEMREIGTQTASDSEPDCPQFDNLCSSVQESANH